MRHTMRHVSLFICILLMAGAAVLIGSRGQSPSNQELGELQVTCFSLENGQAALIQCGDHAVLIDAGSADDAPALLQELEDRQVTRLDALVLSYFSPLRMGGAAQVLRSIPTEAVYAPDYDPPADSQGDYRRLLQAIEERFPGTVKNGVLLRKVLGERVFSDEKALADLNRITHSAVKAEVLRRLESRPTLAAIDAIALFEGGLAPLCNITVAVTAPTEDRVRRLMVRDGISEEYARKRIAAQHDPRWFRERCDWVLDNDSTLEAFQEKCLAFLRQLGIIDSGAKLP